MATRHAQFITLRSIAVVMVVIEVTIHGVPVPSHLNETPSIGVLFGVATMVLTVVLISLLSRRTRTAGWVVGALACAVMFLVFVASRTLGLPDDHETSSSARGLDLMSLPPELIFIGAAFKAVRVRRAPDGNVLPRRIDDSEAAAVRPSRGCHHTKGLALALGPPNQAILDRNNTRRLQT